MPDEKIDFKEFTVRQLLKCIGDDPDRPGLKDTPARVVKAWDELFAGYNMDLAKLITVFDDHDGYDQIVVLRNIEFFSFCEHHMLPFMGYGHVAYLPDERVIGISKLARILDACSRRLTIQERIGQNVVATLEEHLKPRGAACVLVARHTCMSCRGVNKQDSEMVTSSIAGLFREPQVKTELFSLIGAI